MLLKKFLQFSYVFLFLNISLCAQAHLIPYIEDVYLKQAPEEIVAFVQEVVQLIGYEGTYELMSPKELGIKINPNNKFVSSGVNPATGNRFIIVNPEWFSLLTNDQKTFIIGRCVVVFTEGMLPFSVTLAPYFVLLLVFMGVLLVAFILRKIGFLKIHLIFGVLIATVVTVVSNKLFFERFSASLVHTLALKHDKYINYKVLEKTKNKDAALQVFQLLDQSIAQELEKGEPFWVPYANIWKEQMQTLSE